DNFWFFIQLQSPEFDEIFHKSNLFGQRHKLSLVLIQHVAHHLGQLHDRRSGIVVLEICHRIDVVKRIEQEMWAELQLQKLEFGSQLAVSKLDLIPLGRDQVHDKPDHSRAQVKSDRRDRSDEIGVGNGPMRDSLYMHP